MSPPTVRVPAPPVITVRRQEVIDTIYLSNNPTHCLDCHSDKELTVHGNVQNVDHLALGYMTMASNCSGCHDATLGVPFIDPTNNTGA